MSALDETALAQLFVEARTHFDWSQSRALTDEQLREIYALTKMGPTSANASPARFVFVRSEEGKARLMPHLMEQNRDKVKAAPICVIIAYDVRFFDHLPELFPHEPDAKNWFGDEKVAYETAFRNSALQGAYFILAARALGLDVGPMSGFDADALNGEFFADGAWRVNFLCNLGNGNAAALYPRQPRLDFETACRII